MDGGTHEVYPARPDMSASDPLESVMARYVAGDLQAFDDLYARVAPRVHRYLLSMTRDRMRAEDLCQTTFLKLHRGRGGWIPGSPVMPWVMAIARNALYDDSLQAKRTRVKVTTTGDLPDIGDLAVAGEALEAKQSSTELNEVLAQAVDALPLRQREALALTTQGGLTHRDAAAALDTTETAIKLRVHRAYQTLRAALHKYKQSS